MVDDGVEAAEKSRGELLAEQDGLTEDKLESMFSTFYVMRLMQMAAEGLAGIIGNTFKIAYVTRLKYLGDQYTIFDYYATLKEGYMPKIQLPDTYMAVKAELDHMKAANERRMKKGKKLKHSVSIIDKYEEALAEIKERLPHAIPPRVDEEDHDDEGIRDKGHRKARRRKPADHGDRLPEEQGGEDRAAQQGPGEAEKSPGIRYVQSTLFKASSDHIAIPKGAYYRLHGKASEPFCPENAKSTDIGGNDEIFPGYSCFGKIDEFIEYWKRRGEPQDDVPVVIFTGTRVGWGFDNEPLVIPDMKFIKWSTFGEILKMYENGEPKD